MINKLTKEQRHRCMSTIKERNKEEDKKEQCQLAAMDRYCITI